MGGLAQNKPEELSALQMIHPLLASDVDSAAEPVRGPGPNVEFQETRLLSGRPVLGFRLYFHDPQILKPKPR